MVMEKLTTLAASSVLTCILVIPAMACGKEDITLKQADWYRGPGKYVKVVGELINNCDKAVGVALQITFRDSSGKVVGTSVLWPASTDDIPAHTNYPFDVPVEVHAAPDKFEARVW